MVLMAPSVVLMLPSESPTGPPLGHELEHGVVVEDVGGTGASRSHFFLALLLLLLDDEVGDSGSPGEAEQVRASTWSLLVFDGLSLTEFGSAERSGPLDLVEGLHEGSRSPGMLSSDNIGGKLDTLE